MSSLIDSMTNKVKGVFGYPVINQPVELEFRKFIETRQGDYLSEVCYWKKNLNESISTDGDAIDPSTLDVTSFAYTEYPERAHHALKSVCAELEQTGWKITTCSAENTDKWEQVQRIKGIKNCEQTLMD